MHGRLRDWAWIWRTALILLVAVLCWGLVLPHSAGGQAKPKVRLAYLQLGWSATEIIHQEDLLGKRGWDVEYTPIAGSPGGLVNAFAAGQVDAIDMSFAVAGNMFEKGIPLRVTGVATSLLGAVVVPKDSTIASVADLKGKKIAAIVGTSTYADIKHLLKRGYALDIEKEASIVTATSPPDLANLLDTGAVDATIGWQPISDQLVFSGRHRYLVKQIDMWRQATDRHDFPVHVGYLVHPRFLDKHPQFAHDLNEAQQEAVGIWYNQKPLAIKHVAAVTKLPEKLVEFAHDQTVKMMSGLSDEQIDTMTLQLKMLKEMGYLSSDLWDHPERVKEEFFWRGKQD
jgi:ABC-type nitrate/sulfonate/bicarbonate transport system substrate-binding protein